MIEQRFNYFCSLTDPIAAAILTLAESMNAAAMNETLTVEQAAERLGVHVSTIRKRIKEKALPTQRIGRAIRIKAADLDVMDTAKPKRKFRCLKLD
jgi:excisionase family DNA binding protein